MVFERIETKKVYVRIVEQILDLIREGYFKVGDKLPPERIIAEQLGVSRPTVREALSALEIVGLVESKTGQGTFIHSVDLESLKPRAVSLLQEEASPSEILEARRVVETDAAAFAAQRASLEEISEIEKALQALQDETAQSGRFSMETDRWFHLAIANAAGNSVLRELVTTVLDLTRQTLWGMMREKTHAMPDRPEKALQHHRAIYEAIRDRNVEQARAAMLDHLLNVEHGVLGE